MGYDMYLVKTGPNLAEESAAARKAIDEALEARKAIPESEHGNTWDMTGGSERWRQAQQAVSDAFDHADEVRGHFRLNIFGMGRCRNIMDEFGMAWDDFEVWDATKGEYPRIETYVPLGSDGTDDLYDLAYTVRQVDNGRAADDDRAIVAKYDEATLAAIRKYNEADADYLSKTPGETPGIPMHKLCSNDGWVVTAVECRAAVEIWERKGSPVPTDEGTIEPIAWWGSWVNYLRKGAQGDGFTVH